MTIQGTAGAEPLHGEPHPSVPASAGPAGVVVCGEALVDLVPTPEGLFRALPGGSPANVAVTLARLGTPAWLLARLADDGFADVLRHHLRGSGVDTRLCARSAEPTTLAVVTLDPAGVAQYAFYLRGAADGGWTSDDLPAALPEHARAIMAAGSLALAVPPFGDVVEALLGAHKGKRTIVVDPNVRLSLITDRANHRARLDRWVRLADLVKVSDEDLAAVFPEGDPVDIARSWCARGPRAVVVTRGGRGAFAVIGDEVIEVPARPVVVADTVGAGDSFTGGLLDHLARAGLLGPVGFADLDADGLLRAIEFASDVAAVTASRHGADPPRRAELAAGAGAGPGA